MTLVVSRRARARRARAGRGLVRQRRRLDGRLRGAGPASRRPSTCRRRRRPARSARSRPPARSVDPGAGPREAVDRGGARGLPRRRRLLRRPQRQPVLLVRHDDLRLRADRAAGRRPAGPRRDAGRRRLALRRLLAGAAALARRPTRGCPRLHLVQPTGCRPIVAAQAAGAERRGRDRARADASPAGPRSSTPARDRPDAGGAARQRRRRGRGLGRRDRAPSGGALAGLEGIDVEPTAALAPAGLAELVRRGVVRPDESVLIATTGAGLKVPDEGA